MADVQAARHRFIVYPARGMRQTLNIQGIFNEAGNVPGLAYAGGPSEDLTPRIAFSGTQDDRATFRNLLKDTGWRIERDQPIFTLIQQSSGP